MFHTSRVIVVEGKYDQIRLSSLTDALILATDGFGVFTDREKQRFIKKTAKEKGLIVITDSDAAGFRIRNYIQNIAGDADIINVYIPDIYGKESRKPQASKEGKLGVEGMPTEALEEALRRSGLFGESPAEGSEPVTYTDLFEAGLTGNDNCAERRRSFLAYCALPRRLTGASLLKAVNAFMTREDFFKNLRDFDG
ncbi:MAG: DUF4093 domain-containing protein [Clostridia bacterium]|nr:DUF4093 domain-containing protein [Clostridia bacterium]